MKNKWTLFGVGNFFADIYDAILSNDEEIRQIVLNQDIDDKILKWVPSHISIVKLEQFKPQENDSYIFTFLDPGKGPFLKELEKFDIEFTNLVHKTAYLAWDCKLGHGNFIGANAVIGPKTIVGNFNYFNRMSSIGHNTQIGSFNHLGPGSTVAGSSSIGDKNFLGTGASVINGVKIENQPGLTLVCLLR